MKPNTKLDGFDTDSLIKNGAGEMPSIETAKPKIIKSKTVSAASSKKTAQVSEDPIFMCISVPIKKSDYPIIKKIISRLEETSSTRISVTRFVTDLLAKEIKKEIKHV